MRSAIVLFSLLFFVVLSCTSKKQLAIHLTYTASYCGGARPSEEMELEATKPKSYANRTVIFVSEKGKIDSLKTDNYGMLKKKLRKGSYNFYESWRYNLDTPENLPIESFDRECLKNEWQKQIYNVKISKEEIKVVKVAPIVFFCPWAAPCLIQQEVPPSRQ